MRIDTLPISSASRRCLTWLAVSLVPLRPASGDVLMPIVIEIDGSSTVMTGSATGFSMSASVSPIVISGMPATAMMSPGPGLLNGDAVEGLGHQQLDDLGTLDGAVVLDPCDLLALADGALVHAAQREPPEVRGRVEVGDVRLQRLRRVVLGSRHRRQQLTEERLEVLLLRHPAVSRTRQRGAAGLGAGVDDGELDLLLGRVEVEEELVGLVDDLGDSRVRSVDLVDDEDDRKALLQRLAQDEARLRERSLGRRRRAGRRRRPSRVRARPRRRSPRGPGCR